MTSSTTTPARGVGRHQAEGYGLVVFAAILLLVVNYLNPAGTSCS